MEVLLAMSCPHTRRYLEEYLHSTYSEENLMFYSSVQAFKTAYADHQEIDLCAPISELDDPMLLDACAIYRTHLDAEAASPVNLTAAVCKPICDLLQRTGSGRTVLSPTTFDQAQSEALLLLEHSLWPQFKLRLTDAIKETGGALLKDEACLQTLKRAFLRHLAKHHSELKVKYMDSHLVQNNFRHFISIAMAVLDAPNLSVRSLYKLGQLHLMHEVNTSHFSPLGDGFLHALEKALGPRLTGQARAAWVVAWEVITCVMQAGLASGPPPNVAKGKQPAKGGFDTWMADSGELLPTATAIIAEVTANPPPAIRQHTVPATKRRASYSHPERGRDDAFVWGGHGKPTPSAFDFFHEKAFTQSQPTLPNRCEQGTTPSTPYLGKYYRRASLPSAALRQKSPTVQPAVFFPPAGTGGSDTPRSSLASSETDVSFRTNIRFVNLRQMFWKVLPQRQKSLNSEDSTIAIESLPEHGSSLRISSFPIRLRADIEQMQTRKKIFNRTDPT